MDAQLNYYNSCTKTLQDLSRQIGGMGIVNNRSLPPSTPKSPLNPATEASSNFSALNGASMGTAGAMTAAVASVASVTPSSIFNSKKTAKVLFDYEATDPSEMSVSANQVLSKFTQLQKCKHH